MWWQASFTICSFIDFVNIFLLSTQDASTDPFFMKSETGRQGNVEEEMKRQERERQGEMKRGKNVKQ